MATRKDQAKWNVRAERWRKFMEFLLVAMSSTLLVRRFAPEDGALHIMAYFGALLLLSFLLYVVPDLLRIRGESVVAKRRSKGENAHG